MDDVAPAMLQVTIRRGERHDIPVLADLFDMANAGSIAAIWGKQALDGETWRDTCARHMAEPASELHFGKALVAEASGEIAGMLLFFRMEPAAAPVDISRLPPNLRVFAELRNLVPTCVFLRDMAVFPQFRGQGVARKLLDTGIMAGKLAGIDRAAAIVHESSTSLLAHYDRRGMKVVAQRPVVEHNFYAPESQWLLLVLEPGNDDMAAAASEESGVAQ